MVKDFESEFTGNGWLDYEGDEKEIIKMVRLMLNFVISRTREERDKMAAKYGAERFSEGIREERERIATIIKNWHYKKGGYTELAHFIESGKSE